MGSIPLPALALQPPPNPLDQYAKIQGIKSLLAQQQQAQEMRPLQLQEAQNTVQSGALENQQKQFQVQDAQAGMKAMQQWDGKDISQLPDLIKNNGGSLDAVMKSKAALLDQQTKVQNYTKAQLDNEGLKNDYLLGKLQAATDSSIPDEKLSQSVTQAAQQAVQDGYLDPQHAQQLQQITASGDPKAIRDQLALFEKGLMGQKEQFEQQQKVIAERNATMTAQAAQTRAQNSSPTEAGLAIKASQGDAAAVQGLKAIQDQAASKAAAESQAKQPFELELARQRAAIQQSSGGNLEPAALDQAAERYAQTGVLPSMGMGAAGAATRKAIMNRAGELHPDGSLAANSAEFAANKQSLGKLQTNFDQVNAFENTAIKNLDQVIAAGKAIPDLGSRFANVPVRMISEKLIGTPEMAKFKTALLTAQAESAKVLNSANANGVLSDSARHEAEEVLNGNLPFPAMVASANQLKTDFGNRHDSYQQQIQDIKGRLGLKGNSQENNSQSFKAPQGAPSAPAEDGHKLKQGGNVIAVSKGGQWVAPPSQ